MTGALCLTQNAIFANFVVFIWLWEENQKGNKFLIKGCRTQYCSHDHNDAALSPKANQSYKQSPNTYLFNTLTSNYSHFASMLTLCRNKALGRFRICTKWEVLCCAGQFHNCTDSYFAKNIRSGHFVNMTDSTFQLVLISSNMVETMQSFMDVMSRCFNVVRKLS